MKLWFPRISILLVFPVICFACSAGSGPVERIHMFSVEIGRMEDQIDLVQYAGAPFVNEFELALRDGIFYITDSRSRKIMQFNSYGDLLMLLYNSDTNPVPVLVVPAGESEKVVNRRAYSFPFGAVGAFAVTAGGTLYVEDFLDASYREYDEQAKAQLRSVVHKFAPDGRLEISIGQEGIDGRPFPYIHAVHPSSEGGVIVVCRTMVEWRVYSFDSAAVLRYEIRFDPETFPDRDGKVVISLTDMVPDPSGNAIYLKVDFFGADDLVHTDSSFLVFDPISRVYGDPIGLPLVRMTSSNQRLLGASGADTLYEFVGVAAGGFLYAVAPIGDSTYRMLIMAPSGETVYLGTIPIEDEQTLLRSFYVTPEGILSALIAGPLGVDLFVWRFDAILSEVRDEAR